MKTLPVAVQVYSVRDDAERDFKGTMQKLKEMGYDGVELAGLYGLQPAEIKAVLDEVGLVPLSAHVPFQELAADIEGTVAQYKEIGMQYIAIPYLMEEDRPGTEKFLKNIEIFRQIGYYNAETDAMLQSLNSGVTVNDNDTPVGEVKAVFKLEKYA